MPPARSNARRTTAQADDYREFGVVGRKTGVGLPDTGERDEHGLAPVEGLFSSPEKDNGTPSDDGEQEMDLESEAGPGPLSMMKGIPRLLPRGTSPRKSNIQSPAMRNPHMGRSSSPVRGSIIDSDPPVSSTVARKLDYGGSQNSARRANGVNGRQDSADEDEEEEVASSPRADSPLLNGGDDSLAMVGGDDVHEDEPEEEAQEEAESPGPSPTPAPPKRRGRPPRSAAEAKVVEPVKAKSTAPSKGKAREEHRAIELPAIEGATDESEDDEPIVRGKAAQTKAAQTKAVQTKAVQTKAKQKKKDTEPSSSQTSKRRRSARGSLIGDVTDLVESAVEHEAADAPSPKRQRTEAKPGRPAGRPPKNKNKTKEPEPAKKTAPPKAARPAKDDAPEAPSAAKKRGRPRKSDIGEDSIMGRVQKGPPLPKARGLVSLKREASDAIHLTRSGRQSYRPLAYWRNEHVVQDDEEAWDDALGTKRQHSRFVLPSVKEVVRVEEEEAAPKRKPGRTGKKGRPSKAKRQVVDEEEDPEPWELENGRVEGETVVWDPDYELNPPAPDEAVAFEQNELAIASSAIQTREIRDATFRFAKLLSLQFFGAGVVDLPPGTEKKPKNSRKNQMTFFVHYGKVLVTVNETQFRISAGGFWNVPRGNYYNILNDYDQPARLFFAQGNEVMVTEPEPRANRAEESSYAV
ncbi:Inner kinetochore subunit cnp3 like protein [Verticillium longisporum]|uniref:CENP-C homolog n=1 Tax=Verticillium longisporum TaxID=100787 RepID=A0A8I3AVJ2_VERLO|nr:Inner kinetochore subunit cnp3 like protein [Verticillium longisporum]KAG7140925.1 Inner kinetochore subunit cnp3 like protein [Verticillium longisporum]